MTDRWTRLALLPVRLWERLGPRGLVIAAVLLCSPMLFTGFQLDDVVQRALLESPDFVAMDMFRFVRTPADVAARQHEALLPWWSDPNLKLAFFRPVTAWTHLVDGWVAPTFFPWHALHTAAWFAVACLGAAAIYRKALGEKAGAAILFATVAFVLDDAHGMTLGWLANRNAVIAAAFGTWAVASHLSGRRALAALLLGLSLCSSEAGVATVGYLLAAALFVDHRRDRWKALIYVLPVGLWAAAWIQGGYGGAHNDGYFDALGQPRAFASLVLERAPMLWGSAWTVSFVDLWMLLGPRLGHELARAALVLLVPIAWVCWPLVKAVWPTHANPHPDLVPSRGARFLLAGSLLAVVPVCATLPSSRLLLMTGIGVSGLVGSLAAALARGELGRWRTPVVGLLLAVHGLLSPVLLPLALLNVRVFDTLTAGAWSDVLVDAGAAEADAIALQAPVGLFAGYLPFARRLRGEPGPAHLYAIAPSLQRSVVERIDERTLRMQVDRGVAPPAGGVRELPESGTHISAQWLDRTLTDGCPHYDGDVVDMGPFEVRVVEPLPDGRPATFDLVFDAPLEDPSLRFVVFVDGHAREWTPIPVGGTDILPANPLFPR
ncbi:MAG: hypothetical protein H6735_00885 [Alphaproteobacteria bacterium]|nr:hypothetical protein [Alphaproteobacteria bacterium]